MAVVEPSGGSDVDIPLVVVIVPVVVAITSAVFAIALMFKLGDIAVVLVGKISLINTSDGCKPNRAIKQEIISNDH